MFTPSRATHKIRKIEWRWGLLGYGLLHNRLFCLWHVVRIRIFNIWIWVSIKLASPPQSLLSLQSVSSCLPFCHLIVSYSLIKWKSLLKELKSPDRSQIMFPREVDQLRQEIKFFKCKDLLWIEEVLKEFTGWASVLRMNLVSMHGIRIINEEIVWSLFISI